MTRYCARDFTPEEFQQIRSLIKQNPEFNRMRLSKEVCRMLQWLKPDGNLKDMSCCHVAHTQRWVTTLAHPCQRASKKDCIHIKH